MWRMRLVLDEVLFFFSSRRRHTRWPRDWSSDVCSSDLRSKPMHARVVGWHEWDCFCHWPEYWQLFNGSNGNMALALFNQYTDRRIIADWRKCCPKRNEGICNSKNGLSRDYTSIVSHFKDDVYEPQVTYG